MFTGIVQEAGIVRRIKAAKRSIELTVRMSRIAKGLKIGDSVAVNGCCLTVVRQTRRARGVDVQFDLLQETWCRTNLQFATIGSLVNLERSLRANGELSGHFVTGHIDGIGKITRWGRVDQDHVLDIQTPPEVRRYIVLKGSVAVDGISLTVAAVTRRGFRVWIIPHTFKVTNLRERKVGEFVNLEGDIIGKYVEKFTRTRRET